MHISNKRHKLSLQTPPENRVDLRIDLQIVINHIILIHTHKIYTILLHKNPSPLLQHESINQIQTPTLKNNLQLLHYLTFKIYIVNPPRTYTHNEILTLLTLVKINGKQRKILRHTITSQHVTIMTDHPLRLQSKHDDLRLLTNRRPALNVSTKHIEIISKHKGLKSLVKSHLTTTHYLHRHLVVKINKVVLLLNHVSVVVRIKINRFYTSKDHLDLRNNQLHHRTTAFLHSALIMKYKLIMGNLIEEAIHNQI